MLRWKKNTFWKHFGSKVYINFIKTPVWYNWIKNYKKCPYKSQYKSISYRYKTVKHYFIIYCIVSHHTQSHFFFKIFPHVYFTLLTYHKHSNSPLVRSLSPKAALLVRWDFRCPEIIKDYYIAPHHLIKLLFHCRRG
jgi:hypothetical protein